MSQAALAPLRSPAAVLSWRGALVAAGVAAVAIPTLIRIARQSWSTEQGQAGPIVLALAAWLLARRWRAIRAAAVPGPRVIATELCVISAFVYVVGRVSDQLLIESYGLYALGLSGLYALVGWRGMAKGWFALAYFVFVLPVPFALIQLLTVHLRLWITEAVVWSYNAAGVPIVRDGLVIFVDQYQLAVKEACSGLNSLVSLSAIGLVYLYIRRRPAWWYMALFAVPIVVFAIAGNFARVWFLVLLTHVFGDAVAQSYIHEGSGIATFMVALSGVIALDALAAPALLGRPRSAQAPAEALA